MGVEVVAWDPGWSREFERVAADLRRALADLPGAAIEHVGSTSVPGLAAKPVLDIDVIVAAPDVPAAVAARDVLRRRPDLREAYADVKLALAADPAMDIDAYLAGKSAVLQRVLAEAELTEAERAEILALNAPTA